MGIQYNQANNARTTLNGAINNSVTSLVVASSTGFPAVPFIIIIDSEYLTVTAQSGTGNTTWTVTRGADGSSAASHSNGAAITQIVTSAAWNAVVQLQDSTPGTSQTGHLNINGTGQFGSSSYNGTGLAANNNSGIGITGSFTNSGTGRCIVATSTSGNTVDATATTGSAGVFANNGAGTTVTATNSGAGDGLLGTTADNAQFGIKGTNTASTDGAGAGGKFDGGTHAVGAIVTTNHATKEALTLTNTGGGPGLVTPNIKVNGLLRTTDTWASRPGSPVDGDIHYATDRHVEYYWDNSISKWISTHFIERQFQQNGFSGSLTATTALGIFVQPGDYDIYVERVEVFINLASNQSNSNFYTLTMDGATFTAGDNTKSFTTGGAQRLEPTFTAYVRAATNKLIVLTVTPSGSPGNWFSSQFALRYRLVG